MPTGYWNFPFSFSLWNSNEEMLKYLKIWYKQEWVAIQSHLWRVVLFLWASYTLCKDVYGNMHKETHVKICCGYSPHSWHSFYFIHFWVSSLQLWMFYSYKLTLTETSSCWSDMKWRLVKKFSCSLLLRGYRSYKCYHSFTLLAQSCSFHFTDVHLLIIEKMLYPFFINLICPIHLRWKVGSLSIILHWILKTLAQ